MKQYHSFIFLLAMFICTSGFAQQVAINEDGSLPNPNAILDVKSINKGVLFPRTSTATRLTIPNVKGLLVYDTTTHSFWYNTGTAWQNLAAVPLSDSVTVKPRSENDHYCISYESFVPVLAKAIQELNKKVAELSDKNAELRYYIKVLMQNMK